MAWNVWQVSIPQSEEQKKKWRELPEKVFWTKMIILLIMAGSMLALFLFFHFT
tara:strand:- start:1184 stop:1342 length:159 start_codon:yes stop_codon:yes gene_type:complete